jgi:hypothetical protein
MGLGRPVKHEKFGGAGIFARQAAGTGWKACATKTFWKDDISLDRAGNAYVAAGTRPIALSVRTEQKCLLGSDQ